MKNYLIGGLICLVVVLAFGVEPVQRMINETANSGTLRGAEKCMDYSKSELLSEDAVKATCVQSFHTRLYLPNLATGQAGPRFAQGQVGWGGILQNKTSDHVTTWIEIAVMVFDADGTKQEVSVEAPIWIDPLGEAEFRIELPDLERVQFDDIEFCDLEDETPTACMARAVTDVKGLAI